MGIGGIVRDEDVLQRRLCYKFRAGQRFRRDGSDVIEADAVLQVPRDGRLIGRIEGAGNVPALADGVERQLQARELAPRR